MLQHPVAEIRDCGRLAVSPRSANRCFLKGLVLGKPICLAIIEVPNEQRAAIVSLASCRLITSLDEFQTSGRSSELDGSCPCSCSLFRATYDHGRFTAFVRPLTYSTRFAGSNLKPWNLAAKRPLRSITWVTTPCICWPPSSGSKRTL